MVQIILREEKALRNVCDGLFLDLHDFGLPSSGGSRISQRNYMQMKEISPMGGSRPFATQSTSPPTTESANAE